MRCSTRSAGALLVWLVAVGSAPAEDLPKLDPNVARRHAALLLEAIAAKQTGVIEFAGDADLAVGVELPNGKGGMILAPIEGLDAEQLDPRVDRGVGAPLAHLFMSANLAPAPGDGLAPAERIEQLSVRSPDGQQEHRVIHLVLTVRRLADDDWRLRVYGKGEEPLVESKFAEGAGPGDQPVALEVKDVDHQARRGRAVVTVFDRFHASFPVGGRPD